MHVGVGGMPISFFKIYCEIEININPISVCS